MGGFPTNVFIMGKVETHRSHRKKQQVAPSAVSQEEYKAEKGYNTGQKLRQRQTLIGITI